MLQLTDADKERIRNHFGRATYWPEDDAWMCASPGIIGSLPVVLHCAVVLTPGKIGGLTVSVALRKKHERRALLAATQFFPFTSAANIHRCPPIFEPFREAADLGIRVVETYLKWHGKKVADDGA